MDAIFNDRPEFGSSIYPNVEFVRRVSREDGAFDTRVVGLGSTGDVVHRHDDWNAVFLYFYDPLFLLLHSLEARQVRFGQCFDLLLGGCGKAS